MIETPDPKPLTPLQKRAAQMMAESNVAVITDAQLEEMARTTSIDLRRRDD